MSLCRCVGHWGRWWLVCLVFGGASSAFAAPARMLVFVETYVVAPWYAQFLEVLRTSVRAHHPDLELDVETVPQTADAPSGRGDVPPWLLQKYAGKRYDIVLAGNADWAPRLVQLRDRLWPAATVVVPISNEVQHAALKGLPRLTGLRLGDGVAATLELVFTLLPQTRHVAVIASTLDNDPLRPNWRVSLAALAGRAQLIDLSSLSIERLRQEVRRLPPDTVLFFAAPGPSRGRVSTPLDLASELAGLANAPVFVDVSTMLGGGVVGGAVISPDALARDVARQVEMLLAGTPPEQVGIQLQPTPPHVLLDWRALQRWRIPEARLPADSVLIERPPGLWEAYRGAVLAGAAVVLVQTGLIAALLLERRRRQRAELQARQHLAHLARLNRGAALGALSAALAHEISQPLGAILSNAETAELLLERPDDASRAALRELLAEIREDDRRAAAVLSRLRAWIANGPGEPQPVALNPLVIDVARMLHAELQLRETELQLMLAPALPEVVADGVQVQQVVLNLVLNALEALQAVPARQRRIVVATTLHGHGHCEVSVRDSGPGLQGEAHERLFEPFFSTKPQGLGVGLAISRSIVERHRGRLRVEAAGEGTCFAFTLPIHVPPPAAALLARAA